ncbi:MAG: septum formation initiator family protein [Tenuifilum sp.]|uniref:FtsB family cell division protein n=2 Tax=Tenuifilum sp. TaxID=2760880 RepID=UPI001B5E8E74|nr:septum formation initiator family protein [Bacteroidales bacterium]HOK61867.1 septum formation initiator family protein [Tenuifilum sp.]MBP9029834.1 septum formation initiator family protein [Bacteroidales bacterium]HOK86597.1 septum formation initiator family protein [Tenuifilum sp.]HON71140.1 septum formation initiator family protein [Tenuifilum sp.]
MEVDMPVSEITFWKWFLPKLRNKFFLTVFIFLIWMLIFDSSNWVEMLAAKRRIKSLEEEKVYYLQKIEEDKKKIKELRTNAENLEKFAREQYLMKKPNEDIFIVDETDL